MIDAPSFLAGPHRIASSFDYRNHMEAGSLSATSFPSGFSPDFFKLPAAQAANTSSAAHAGGESISFPQYEQETVAEFEQSLQFAQFKQEFLAHVACVNQFAKDYLGDTEHAVCHAFDELARRLFDTQYDFFAENKCTLYGVGKRSLEQLSHLLKDADIDLALRQTCVLQLADGIDKCAAGAAVNLAEATQTLQAAHGDQFLRIKDEVATALVTEAYRELTSGRAPITFTITLQEKTILAVPNEYEIHFATFLRNALAESLGLQRREDPAPEKCEFSSEAIEYCRQYVAQRLTPARLAMALAEEYLQTFLKPIVEAIDPAGAGKHRHMTMLFNYTTWSQRLDDARLPLKAYGEVSLHSLIRAADPNSKRFRLNTDPTLVALDILNQQRRNGAVTASYIPGEIVDWRYKDADIRIRHLAGQLAWSVEDGDASPLSTKHLILVSPKDFPDREDVAKLIIHNVVKNTLPERLQACLSLEWLSIADTAEVFSRWNPATLSRYLKRHANHMTALNPSQKHAIAKGVIACGSLADLNICVKHGCMLFEPPADAGRLPAFFQIALRRGDILMLTGLLRLLESSMAKNSTIKQQIGAILASADEFDVPALFNVLAQTKRNPALSAYYNIVLGAATSKMITSAQLEHILAARDARNIPGLTIAMKNNDCEKIGEYGATLMDAHASRLLDGRQFARLLNALDARGASALLQGICDDHEDAIEYYGSIVMAAFTKKILSPAQVLALLSPADGKEEWSYLWYAARIGKTAAVTALGKVLVSANESGALSNAQVFTLMRGPAAAKHHVLESALRAKHPDAVIASGMVLVTLYENGALNRDQVRIALSPSTQDGTRCLLEILTLPDGEAAVDALGRIVLAADAIRYSTDGPASAPLSAPESLRAILPQELAMACTDAQIDTLPDAIRTICAELQAWPQFSEQIAERLYALEQRIHRSRLGLFFGSNVPEASAKRFTDIQQEWGEFEDWYWR
jgi:hypothetical protein